MGTTQNFSSHTRVDWYNFCRDVCIEILLQDNRQIGGPGHIVEIDESKFGSRKYNKGKRVDGVWVFGGIDRTTRETFFEIVPDRSAATLVPLVRRHVHPDTTVFSDCWKAYHNLKDHFHQHNTVNHSVNFVDPDDPILHTNRIESTWRVLKKSILPKNGTTKELYPSYFAQYCVWNRYLVGSECRFKAFLDLIKRVYPLPQRSLEPENPATLLDSAAGTCSRPISSNPGKKQKISVDLGSDMSDFEV